MLYLNTDDLNHIGIRWNNTVNVIERAAACLDTGDFSQPVKPYVRFKDPANRIIAMPAYVGETFSMAGLKWIASFPHNIDQGIQRAHSVTVLNDSSTGVPLSVINSGLISGIRTASVSGLVIQKFLQAKKASGLTAGIIGFGPIGQLHLRMMMELFPESIQKVLLYDIRQVDENDIPDSIKERVQICRSWEEVYLQSDILMTCTVSSHRYIDKKPKDGSLLLNVSLRDFKSDIYDYTQTIAVDDWEEVCRENTDIEMMHQVKGLRKEDTFSIVDIVTGGVLERLTSSEAVMFNPMGMAVFDIAIGSYYYHQAAASGIGTELKG
ncbi:2,3-diaminopropionate biosynthesis protein SbnB [Paenibacillus sp. HJL G12]|uniref:2,3-diaminopropionate biosynthesis protein SbnB n=1 Tax=Paenibacillus dendrobii TaxID=2691084 RepID=A0A7X3IJL2_9BACL|nr:2,3-diaminopropionate biosynthesis protein SbnB [Paenibacillus dendrobii]MWV44651.1 2,3-diaminopropionate biosynthesis protein SbnB [Paenibacillus dendrobii]